MQDVLEAAAEAHEACLLLVPARLQLQVDWVLPHLWCNHTVILHFLHNIRPRSPQPPQWS